MKTIKSKEEFLDALLKERARRKTIEKAQEKKLAEIEKEKKLKIAREKFEKMSGGIPKLKG